ncbi:MAG TPA: L-threonylcarbamoyladenylate synthase [Alphaproteobacteria bacterium]|nr:L-threonylcarbamoyladenylate synthase [Alphaproteobacteria bacterium]
MNRAAELLRAGKLVAFPTETVYGLGADATNDKAVASIYAAKGRPQFNPLIIHLPDAHAARDLVEWNETAQSLADQFWPGPLTLILPRKKDCHVSLLASAGMDTLAVRVPHHPVALELLKAVALPIAAPSANASGKLSPTTPVHVAESLGDKVDMILAGGKAQVGVESTVLNLTSKVPTILRHGGVTKEKLEQLLGKVDVADGNSDAPLSPGMLASHYAPNIPVRLNASSVNADEALLAFGPDRFIRGGKARLNLSERGDMEEAAANLFAMMRQLDKPDHTGIAVMEIPNVGLGAAINDRLKRASTPA